MKIKKLKSCRLNCWSPRMISQAQMPMPTIRKKIVPRLFATAVREFVYVMAEWSPSIAEKCTKRIKSVIKKNATSAVIAPMSANQHAIAMGAAIISLVLYMIP